MKKLGSQLKIYPRHPEKKLSWSVLAFLAIPGHWEKRPQQNLLIQIRVLTICMTFVLPKHHSKYLRHHLNTVRHLPDTLQKSAFYFICRFKKKGCWVNIMIVIHHPAIDLTFLPPTHQSMSLRHKPDSPRHPPDTYYLRF